MDTAYRATTNAQPLINLLSKFDSFIFIGKMRFLRYCLATSSTGECVAVNFSVATARSLSKRETRLRSWHITLALRLAAAQILRDAGHEE